MKIRGSVFMYGFLHEVQCLIMSQLSIGTDNEWMTLKPVSPLTLKTNISRLKKATVLKLPSQMLGLPLPGSAGRSPGGRAGREWRSCLRSEVECVRREGKVGNGLVGSSMAVGIPGGKTHESFHCGDLFLFVFLVTWGDSVWLGTQRSTTTWVTLLLTDFSCVNTSFYVTSSETPHEEIDNMSNFSVIHFQVQSFLAEYRAQCWSWTDKRRSIQSQSLFPLYDAPIIFF